MNDCCAIPLNNNKMDVTARPTCGQKGKPVQALTIRSLTRNDWYNFEKITDGYYCINPDDPTVYFFPDNEDVIDKRNVKVRVGIKEIDEPLLVCYCFNHNKSAIEEDFLNHGYSMIESDIRKKVKDKQCSCEIKNPSGRCCLGDIRITYSKLDKETTQV